MRKILVLSAICLFSQAILAAKVSVDIKGMTCQMCVSSITRELNATKKVKDVQVSLEKKGATFETIEKADLSDAEIKDAVKKAGYEVTSIKRN